MKNIIYCSLLLFVTTTSLAQQSDTTSASMAKEYLKKSKAQKIWGYTSMSAGIIILAVTGTGAAVEKAANTTQGFVGAVLGGGGQMPPPEKSNYTLGIVTGLAAIIGSIILLNAAKENKVAASFASVGLKMERLEPTPHLVKVNEAYPSIALKLKL